MTDKSLTLRPETGLTKAQGSYLERLVSQPPAEVADEEPEPAPRMIQTTKRAKAGTDIESLVPEMAEDAKKRLARVMFGPLKAVEMIERRGFCIVVGHPDQMDVSLTFNVSYDKAAAKMQAAMAHEYAALNAPVEEQKALAIKGVDEE